jgi:hypothetical protein
VLLGSGEIDAHHAPVPVALGLPDDDVVQLVVELAGEAEDQAGADAVREASAIHAADRGRDDVVEVPFAAQVPLHGVEAELDGRDARGAVLLPDDRVDRALDGRRRRLDALRPSVEDVEVPLQRRDAVGVRVDEVLELGVGLHRQLEPVVVGDLPEHVRRHRGADVDVEVDELGGLEGLPRPRRRARLRREGRADGTAHPPARWSREGGRRPARILMPSSAATLPSRAA